VSNIPLVNSKHYKLVSFSGRALCGWTRPTKATANGLVCVRVPAEMSQNFSKPNQNESRNEMSPGKAVQ
jgi:hypothetical protein